eukprot:7549957-Ditylum_brightwellii.AAC.1
MEMPWEHALDQPEGLPAGVVAEAVEGSGAASAETWTPSTYWRSWLEPAAAACNDVLAAALDRK